MIPVERVLADGTTIHVRDIRPEDAAALREGFDRLSPQSRYSRFLGGISTLTPAALRYLTQVDGVNHVAIVAARHGADGEEIGVGVARYVRLQNEPKIAEAAITVTDEWQGKGVGRMLANELKQEALAHGIEHFRGEVLVDNAPCRELLRDVGAVTTAAGDGRIAFDVALVGRADDVAGRLLRAAATGAVGSRLP